MKVKLPFEPSIPAQEAAIAAMDDNNHLEKTIKINESEKTIIENNLKQMNVNFIKSSTNFITLIFESDFQALTFTKLMLQNGIIVRHLDSFGLAECVRVTVGTSEENKVYIKILQKIINKVYEKV